MNFYNLYRVTVFLLGLTSTLIIFKFDIGIGSVYFFDLFFYLLIAISILYLFKKKKLIYKQIKNINFKISINMYILFLVITIFSVLIPVFDNANFMWIFTAFKSVINKWIPTLILVIMLQFMDKNYNLHFYKNFINGFIVSIFIHAIWSIIGLILWFGYNISLNYVMLEKLKLDVGHSAYSLAYPGILRMSGLHWDPAWYGIWAPIAFFWIQLFIEKTINKFIFSIIILLPWIFTFSRTGAFSFGFVIVLYLSYKLFSLISLNFIIKKRKIFKSIKIIIICSFLVIIVISTIMLSYSEIITGILESRTNLEASGTSRHFNYLTKGYKVLGIGGIHNFLLGFGYRNAGRGLISDEYLRKEILVSDDFGQNKIWDPESDWARILIGLGIIGFLLFILYNIFMVRSSLILIKYKVLVKYNYFYLFSILLIFTAGLFYSYSDDRWYHLILVSYVSLLNTQK